MTDQEIAEVIRVIKQGAPDGPMGPDAYRAIEAQLAPHPDVDLNRVIDVWNQYCLGPDEPVLSSFNIRATMKAYGMDHTQ